MSKIRKAITAGLVAAAGAVATAITTKGLPSDSAGWTELLVTAAGAGLVALLAVWRVPNAPAVTRPSTDPIRRPPL